MNAKQWAKSAGGDLVTANFVSLVVDDVDVPVSNKVMNSIDEPESEGVNIFLKRPHALVLFEFLFRYSQEEKLEIKDQAEQRVLWDVCCDLERTLDEPFRPDYEMLLERARESVRDREV